MGSQNANVKVHKNDRSDLSEIADRARLERAERIKLLRQSSGLSQAEFAANLGVAKTTQLKYEAGTTAPDADYLDALYFQYAVDLTTLVTGVPRPKSPKLTPELQELTARYAALPPKLRKTVDDVLLLAWLAYQDRAAYHAQDAAPASAPKKAKRGE